MAINNLTEEERRILILRNRIRELRKLYNENRRTYLDELEQIIACCFYQNRIMYFDEQNTLEILYKKYLNSYREFLEAKEKLSSYRSQLRWLSSQC